MRLSVKLSFNYRGIMLSIGTFALLTLLFVSAFKSISDRTIEQEAVFIQNTLKRAAVTCFAIEGRYPPTIEYLMEHYGIQYSQERYIISYSAFASNIFPDIAVLRLGVSP